MTRLLDAARAGGDLLAILAGAAEHLEVCPSCRASAGTLLDTVLPAELAAQLRLQALEEAGQLAEPPSYPRFDLSFLEPITAPTIWSDVPTTEALSAGIRRLAAGLQLTVRLGRRRLGAAFEDLDSLLQPLLQPAPLAAALRGTEAGAPGELLTLPDPERGADLLLTVQATGGRRGQLSVEVRWRAGARSTPRCRIRLQSAEGVESLWTEQNRAVFAALGPGHYALQIQPAGPAGLLPGWQLDLTLRPG